MSLSNSKKLDKITILFMSDQFDGEGSKTFLSEQDSVIKLFRIDFLLFSKLSRLASIWRNLVKFVILPYQVYVLRKALAAIDDDLIIHAHSTYYAFLASFTNIKYISTPQGSELLVRLRNPFYRFFSWWAHKKANIVTVDSRAMSDSAKEYLKLDCLIIQNGIDVSRFSHGIDLEKKMILSLRGCTPNYQIHKIFQAQKKFNCPLISFCFPFFEEDYFEEILREKRIQDDVLGQLNRAEFHNVLKTSWLVISIPVSDSSPRSVYEAIFSGAVVLSTYHGFVDDMPKCMRERLIVVDLKDPLWLKKGISRAQKIKNQQYIPSEEAKKKFDQMQSMQLIIEKAMKITTGNH